MHFRRVACDVDWISDGMQCAAKIAKKRNKNDPPATQDPRKLTQRDESGGKGDQILHSGGHVARLSAVRTCDEYCTIEVSRENGDASDM